MPLFSARMTFDVTSSGQASVTEERIIHNDTPAPLKLPPYYEILPEPIDLSSFRIYMEHGPDDRRPVGHDIQDVPGTNRRSFRVPKAPEKSFEVDTGKVSLVTTFSIGQFYDTFNHDNLYVFHFHHSLPSCPYLDCAVPKTIIVNIEKPKYVLSVWDAIFILPPNNAYEDALKSFSKKLSFEFAFSLSPQQHYFNTVILRRRLRLLNLAPRLLKLGMSVLRKKGVPG